MIKKFIKSKLFFLFTSLFIIGFLIGYDYAVISANNMKAYSEDPPYKNDVTINNPVVSGDDNSQSDMQDNTYDDNQNTAGDITNELPDNSLLDVPSDSTSGDGTDQHTDTLQDSTGQGKDDSTQQDSLQSSVEDDQQDMGTDVDGTTIPDNSGSIPQDAD
ncbi:MAG: hypothetical protein Q8920_16025 [Bacillota bacterium]|nr:hypothetical protein [Bacillota bacterium]